MIAGRGTLRSIKASLGFGKVESAALDRWADGMANSGVAQDLMEMGAVHK